MKKKLGVVAALAMIVTVGGVYAQWSYSQAPAGGMGGTKAIELSGVSTTTKTGVINVNTDHFTIEIDDADKDYYGELVLSGTVTVTFTPNPGVDEDVENQGIPMQMVLSSANGVNFEYDFGAGAVDVFTLNSTPVVYNAGARTKTWTITAAEIANYFQLNGKDGEKDSCIYLPTYDDYDDFKTALAGLELMITVSEYVPTP